MNPECINNANCTNDDELDIDDIFLPVNIFLNDVLYTTCAMIVFLIMTCLTIMCCIKPAATIYAINYICQIILVMMETILLCQYLCINYKITNIINNLGCYNLVNYDVFNDLANSNNIICHILFFHLILSSTIIIIMAYIMIRYHLLLAKYKTRE